MRIANPSKHLNRLILYSLPLTLMSLKLNYLNLNYLIT
jgi:hypothetical protein